MRATAFIVLSSISCALAAPIGLGDVTATVDNLTGDGTGAGDIVAEVSTSLLDGSVVDAGLAINLCETLNQIVDLLGLDALLDCNSLPATPPPAECDASAPPRVHAVEPEDGDDGGDDEGYDSGDDGEGDDSGDDGGDDWDDSGDVGGLGNDDDGEDDDSDDNLDFGGEESGGDEDCECDDEDDGDDNDDEDDGQNAASHPWTSDPPPTAQDGDDGLANPPVLHAVEPTSTAEQVAALPTSVGEGLLPCLDPCVSGVLDTVLHLGVGDVLGDDSTVGSLLHVAGLGGGDDSPVSDLVHVAVGGGDHDDGLLGGGGDSLLSGLL